jgi:hypothetical protein
VGAPDLLGQLAAAGIRLRSKGEKLLAEPREALTDELRAAIRANKRALLAALSPKVQPRLEPQARPVVRLCLLLQAEDGQRCEALLAIPAERYDGLRFLELFEQHRMAGTTRVIGISEVPA